MRRLLTLPHRVCESTCYVNGLEDVLTWEGGEFMDYLLPVVGGTASFTYLKFKMARPPCMVYWGANPKYLMKDLEKVIEFKQAVTEGRSFRNVFPKIKEFIDKGSPVMAGALDMYYLHYYPDLYGRQHVPIHYVLVVGYDDNERVVIVHDCSRSEPQTVPYDEFEKSLDVNVPGMSKRNTIRVFKLPEEIPSELKMAKKGFSLKAEKMLDPPIRMLGIPAMRRLSKEILSWDNKECFEHLVTYATTPPMLPVSLEHSDGMRFWQANVLRELGEKYRIGQWIEGSELFAQSGRLVIELCGFALKRDAGNASEVLVRIAEVEEKGYRLLKAVR